MAVAAEIGAACDDIGFFYAVNHNVSVEVIDRTLAAVDSFFSLPIEEKLKVECDRNNRGYREGRRHDPCQRQGDARATASTSASR
jgi:isopenicillin N synthase-like dioxygenase